MLSWPATKLPGLFFFWQKSNQPNSPFTEITLRELMWANQLLRVMCFKIRWTKVASEGVFHVLASLCLECPLLVFLLGRLWSVLFNFAVLPWLASAPLCSGIPRGVAWPGPFTAHQPSLHCSYEQKSSVLRFHIFIPSTLPKAQLKPINIALKLERKTKQKNIHLAESEKLLAYTATVLFSSENSKISNTQKPEILNFYIP